MFLQRSMKVGNSFGGMDTFFKRIEI